MNDGAQPPAAPAGTMRELLAISLLSRLLGTVEGVASVAASGHTTLELVASGLRADAAQIRHELDKLLGRGGSRTDG